MSTYPYPPLTPDSYRVLRRLSGYTQTEIARLTGVTDRSARRWESTHYPPLEAQQAVIDRIDQIKADARELVERGPVDDALVHGDPDVLAVAWIMHDDPAVSLVLAGPGRESSTLPTALDAGKGSLEILVEDLETLDVVYDVRQRPHTVEYRHGDRFTMSITRDDGREERYDNGTTIRVDRPYPAS